MSEALIVHKQLYQVFIKWIEEPVEISWKNWELLGKTLLQKDCPPFVHIDWWFYNRYEIARVVPYEEKISPARAAALADMAALDKLTKWIWN